MDAVFDLLGGLLRRPADDDGAAGIPRRRDARLLGDGGRARPRRGQAPRQAASADIARQRNQAHGLRNSSINAATAASRLHHQALFHRRQQGHEGAAPAADAGRHLRSARVGILFRRAHRAGSRARYGRVLPGARAVFGGRIEILDAGEAPQASSVMSPRASTSTGASRRARPSTSRASRTSWTFWWSAPIPG